MSVQEKLFALNPASAFGGGGHSVGVSKMLSIRLSIFNPPTERFGGYSDEHSICPSSQSVLPFLCWLCNLNTVRNILMILHSYVKQVMTMRALTFIL